MNLADNVDTTNLGAQLAQKVEANSPLQDHRLEIILAAWDKLPESLKDSFAAKAEIHALPLAKFD